MNTFKLKKAITTFIIGSFVVSSGVIGIIASAQTNAPKGSTTKTSAPASKNNNFNNSYNDYTKKLQTQLDLLVKNNTINKTQETKVLTALTQRRNNQGQRNHNWQNNGQRPQNNNFQNMTDAQRKAFMANRAKSIPNPLADLVKNKTITQKQSDAINKAISSIRGNFGGPRNFNNPPAN